MKFTDGYWKLRANVEAIYAIAVEDIECSPAGMKVYGLTRPLRHRGDTLNAPLLTAEISSPMEDVVRVRLNRWDGGIDRVPAFALAGGETGSCEESPKTATFTSGAVSVCVERGAPWNLEFLANGRPLTASRAKAFGSIRMAGLPYIHEQLDLDVGEMVYGLGERFGPFVKNGQSIEIWNRDGGTASEQAYKNIPFYLTNRGYGVFVNDPGAVSFEVASERVARVQFSLPGDTIEYFIIYGPTPKEILGKYTALTGRPALPPRWSFGLWLSTSFTTSYDEETVTTFVQGMADRSLPLHVLHYDCFWMRQFNWCDLTWDRTCFPDPEGMLRRLKKRGLHISLWINPYIAQRSALFAQGKAAGYLLRKADGGVRQTDDWQAGMGIVDFTNPGAKAWFAGKLRELLEMGADCFKTDFGERIPTDVVYHDGSDPERMHNYYSLLYNRVVFELLEEVRGKGEAVVFARSATVGGQQYPVHWGGDCESTFPAMAESLRGGLSLGLCGFGFWSHDIGGFEGTPDPAVYKRWIAFGLLSSHSRLHGSGSYRVPWLFDEEAVQVLRHFTNLKCRLMPYLYTHARVAAQAGVPMMRAMLLEFPDDPACATLDRQYMLGDALLVAPVFSALGDVEYYLPDGIWTEYLTGKQAIGGRWLRERHGFESLPMWVRPNSVIPVGADAQRPDYDYCADVTLQIYGLGDGNEARCAVPGADGEPDARARVWRAGSRIGVEVEGLHTWSALLMGARHGRAGDGCDVEDVREGVRLLPAPGAQRITVEADLSA